MLVFNREKYEYSQAIGIVKPAAWLLAVNPWLRYPTALLAGMVVGSILNYFV